MLNIIVFSKDRGCQLDALLQSLLFFVKMEHKISVVYTYSHNRFKKVYDELIKLYHYVNFVKEQNFKQDILNLLDSSFEITIFLSDDMILKRELIETPEIKYFLENEEILGIKTIAGRNLKQRFDDGVLLPQPKFIDNKENFNIWNWREHRRITLWGYPMSVATQFYRTKDLIGYLPRINFNSPNFMESEMDKQPLNKPLMMCYDESLFILLQLNRVQQTHTNNRHGKVRLEQLNDKWFDDKRIQWSVWTRLRDDVMEFLNPPVYYINKFQPLHHGVTRSGSTLVWQIMKRLFHNDEKFRRTHDYIPFNPLNRVTITLRDFRDVLTSYWRVMLATDSPTYEKDFEQGSIRQMTKEEVDKYSNIILGNLNKHLNKMKEDYKGNYLLLRYEKFKDNFEYIFNELERFYNIKITRPEREELKREYTITRNKDRQKSHKTFATWDHVSKIHGRHIYDGNVGMWKKYVPEELHDYVNELFRDVLKTWGYEI